MDVLHSEGVVHIESAPLRGGAIPLRRLAADEAIERERTELERIRAVVTRCLLLMPPLSGAAMAAAEPVPRTLAGFRDVGGRIAAIMGRVDQLARRRKVIEDELAVVARYQRIMTVLAPLLQSVPTSRDIEYVGITLERRDPETIRTLRDALSRLTDDRFELLLAEVDEHFTAGLLVCPAAAALRVRAALGDQGIGEMPVPASLAGQPWSRAVAIVLKRQTRLPAALDRCRSALARVSRRWRVWFEDLDRVLEDRLTQLGALVWFYETEMTFLIDGWVPRTQVDRLREHLQRSLGGAVVVEARDAPIVDQVSADRISGEVPEVPVALSNPRWMAPFESLVRLITLPRYGSVDPTPYLAVGFPFFVGMIVGDVVYGVVLLVLVLWLAHRCPDHTVIGPAARIGFWACLWVIVFGVLYGEYAGTLGARWGLRPVLVDRLHAFTGLLAATAGMGALHIVLGVGLGIRTAARAGRWSEVRGKGGGLLVLLGLLVLVARAGGFLPPGTTWPAAGTIVLGSVVLASAKEGKAFMELHNLVNVLSYLRLMGIGVASAALAFAANLLGTMSGHPVLAVLIGLLLHGINLAFAVVSPSIQSLRLHYVEFFENFVEPGGREYRPFRRVEAMGNTGRGVI